MSITSYPALVSISSTDNVVSLGGTNVDSFGRLRVSNPYSLFDSSNRYAADAQFDVSTSSGGSTSFLPNEAAVTMSVTTTSGSEVVRQSYRRFPYQPGKSLLVLATFVMDDTEPNLRQRVGYFDTQNGVFFQKNGNTNQFVLRSYVTGAVSDSRTVAQSSWNGDKLDGTGPSGYTIDPTKSQILWIDFEWLGVGSVRCGFIIDGKFILCHTFHNANSLTSVYMTTATLPIRYEITNTDTASSSSTMKAICASVISEAGYEQISADHIARRTTALSTISTTFLPLVSIRLASTALGAIVLPNRVAVIPTTGQNYEVALFKNATLTGASWSAVASNSNVEQDISATAMTGGTIVQVDYVSSSGSGGNTVLDSATGYNWDIQLGVSLANVSDVYTVGVRTLSATPSGNAFGALSFYDLSL